MSDIIVKQGLISQPNLAKWLDLSRSGLEKLRKKDLTFPEPIKNGHHQQSACHYVFAEVEAWINSRISDRDSDSQRSRLIAAAPELLEAAIQSIPLLEEYMQIGIDTDAPYSADAFEAVLLIMKHAISKATGADHE